MKKNKNYKFKIGQWVKVIAKAEFYYDEKNDRQVKFPLYDTNLVGQIVGATTKYLGHYENGNNKYDWDGTPDYDPPFLSVTKGIIIWQVKLGVTNKPIETTEDCLIVLTDDNLDQKVLPWFYSAPQEYTREYRERVREEVKTAPRDAKGRWLKL